MNIITFDAAYCLFPRATLEEHRSLLKLQEMQQAQQPTFMWQEKFDEQQSMLKGLQNQLESSQSQLKEMLQLRGMIEESNRHVAELQAANSVHSQIQSDLRGEIETLRNSLKQHEGPESSPSSMNTSKLVVDSTETRQDK